MGQSAQALVEADALVLEVTEHSGWGEKGEAPFNLDRVMMNGWCAGAVRCRLRAARHFHASNDDLA